MKLLTIGIPTYNREYKLNELLEELCNDIIKFELDTDIEILISDNYSKDNTEIIVNDYMNKFTFIKYNKNSKNLGYAKNIDKLILNATTEYIWLMGDDDKIITENIKYVIQVLKEKQPDYLILNSRMAKFQNNKIEYEESFYLKNFTESDLYEKKDILQKNVINHLGFLGVNCFKVECGQKAINELESRSIMHSQMISLWIISNCDKIYLLTVVVVDDFCDKKYGPIQLVDVNIKARIEMLEDLDKLDNKVKDYLYSYLIENIKEIGKQMIYFKLFKNYDTIQIWRNIDVSKINIKSKIIYYIILLLLLLPKRILNIIIKISNKNYIYTKRVYENLEFEDKKTFYLED